MDTEICTVWPKETGGKLKASCPLNEPPLTGISNVVTEPRSVFDDVSYATPTAVNALLIDAQVAETGTII
jgi:hypothetical protein